MRESFYRNELKKQRQANGVTLYMIKVGIIMQETRTDIPPLGERDEPKTRTEEAIEMGVKIPEDGYWGNVPSKICGAVGGAIGGEMMKRMVEAYEKKLAGDETTQSKGE